MTGKLYVQQTEQPNDHNVVMCLQILFEVYFQTRVNSDFFKPVEILLQYNLGKIVSLLDGFHLELSSAFNVLPTEYTC